MTDHDRLNESLPPAIDALIEQYNLDILDASDGTMATAQLRPYQWERVVRAAHEAGDLRAVRVQLGTAWAIAVVDVGQYTVTITTAPDASRPLVLLDLEGL